MHIMVPSRLLRRSAPDRTPISDSDTSTDELFSDFSQSYCATNSGDSADNVSFSTTILGDCSYHSTNKDTPANRETVVEANAIADITAIIVTDHFLDPINITDKKPGSVSESFLQSNCLFEAIHVALYVAQPSTLSTSKRVAEHEAIHLDETVRAAVRLTQYDAFCVDEAVGHTDYLARPIVITVGHA